MEKDKLVHSNTTIEWHPDNIFDAINTDICVFGSKKDVDTIMHIIGRK